MSPPTRPTRQTTILVVDDEPTIREMVCKLLARHGYAVDSADHAAEAMTHLKKSRVDLVILDGALPDDDGLNLARLIKKMDPTLPILLFSDTGFEAHLETQARQVGAAAYVSKTAPFSKLVSAVRRVLANPRGLTKGFTEILRKGKAKG